MTPTLTERRRQDVLARLDEQIAAALRRERAARPRRGIRRRSASIAVRLEPSVAELWRLAAAAEGLTLTDWMERAAMARLQSTSVDRLGEVRRTTPQTEAQMLAALTESIQALGR